MFFFVDVEVASFVIFLVCFQRPQAVKLVVPLILSFRAFTVFGIIGVYRIPLDIVAAPACNVAIAMGVDSMIHMIQSYKMLGNWEKVREEIWRPVLTAMLVVCTGFAIVLCSNFPPTARFGTTIFFGSFLAGLIALFIMPLLYQFFASLLQKKTSI